MGTTDPRPTGWPSCASRLAVSAAMWAGLSVACLEPARPPLRPSRPVVAPPAVAKPVPPTGPEHSPIEPVEPRAAALLDTGELIAGQRDALVAWRADGAAHRVISSGAALFPRRFGREHALVLRPLQASELRDGFALDLVALATGERRELARVPAFRCAEPSAPEQPNPASLSVHDPLDLEVDPRRGVACIGLMDATSNRAHVRVRVRVDLRTQRVERWLALGEDGCTPLEGVHLGDPAPDGSCWANPLVARQPPDVTAFPFTFVEEHVRMPAAPRGGATTRLRGYQLEEPSPSGRWLLLAGDYIEREVVYRRLLLFDRSEGKLYPIPSLPGVWPPPLAATGAQFKIPVREAQLFAAATDVRWLGDAQAPEYLVLDARVVRPGERFFDITDGSFAR